MANPFITPGIDMQSPEAVQIMRRQQMAKTLLEQSQDPLQGQMVSGHFVAPSWTQQLAKGLQGYLGNKTLKEADQAMAAMGQETKQRNQADMQKFVELLQGKPAQQVEAMPVQDESGYRQEGFNRQVTETPAVAPDMNAAYQFAAASQNPALQQYGMQGIMQMPQLAAQKAARDEERAWRSQEAEANRAQRMQELEMRMQDARASQQERLAAQKELRDMQIQAQKETRQMIAANRPERQAQVITTDQGMGTIVGGKFVPLTDATGKPLMGPKAAGAPAATRTQDARDALATIDMAEKLIGQSTGSGVGSMVDTAAGFFGKSTEGAQAASKLRALEGDLVAKMPKMSGPQSDKDVLLYKQMAGQIGDPSIPRATKQAALQTIREIQNRYASGVSQGATGSWDAPAQSQMPTGFKVVR